MDTVVAMIPFNVANENKVRLSEYEALINEDVTSFYEPGSYTNVIKNAAESVLEDDDPNILENSNVDNLKENDCIDSLQN